MYGCYIHEEAHTQYELCDSCVCLREIIYNFFGQSSAWACQKLEHWDFLRHRKCRSKHTTGSTEHLLIRQKTKQDRMQIFKRIHFFKATCKQHKKTNSCCQLVHLVHTSFWKNPECNMGYFNEKNSTQLKWA